jgi:hypothetical protein
LISAAVEQVLECLDHVTLLSGCCNTSDAAVVDSVIADPHIAYLLEVCLFHSLLYVMMQQFGFVVNIDDLHIYTGVAARRCFFFFAYF